MEGGPGRKPRDQASMDSYWGSTALEDRLSCLWSLLPHTFYFTPNGSPSFLFLPSEGLYSFPRFQGQLLAFMFPRASLSKPSTSRGALSLVLGLVAGYPCGRSHALPRTPRHKPSPDQHARRQWRSLQNWYEFSWRSESASFVFWHNSTG